MRCRLFSILAFQFLLIASAYADNYPTHTIRMIVPFAPGGTADLIARPLAQRMGQILGQSVIVMNKGGAGGAVGAAFAAQAKNDGYTIFLGSNGALTISQHLGPLPYDSVKDFSPVGIVANSQFVLVTHPSLPVRNVQDLIALAKQKDGEMAFGSAGVGNVGDLAADLFDSMAGVRMIDVPYAGTGPMTVDLLSGRIKLAYPGLSSVVPAIKDGRLRALAVTAKTRSPLLPDVPTLDESGLRGYDAETFWAILVPAGTPEPIVAKLNAALIETFKSAETRKLYSDAGNEPAPSSPQELAQRIRDDTRKWGDIIQRAGIKKN